MGVRLDWEIEAEQVQVKSAGEDPVTRRQRRLARLRLLLFIASFLALVIAGVVFVNMRLEGVNAEVEQALRNTVQAEVAALRLGDLNAFSQTQRSASRDWLDAQRNLFYDYQALKTQQSIELTGQILNVTIDKARARVTVQEIINGIPYSRVWFYWRYEDGWYHVPPDYTFWGERNTFTTQGVTVRYRDVDATLGKSLGEKLSAWMQSTCQALPCSQQPALQIEIFPDETMLLDWVDESSWTINMPSPYLRRARTDMPFDRQLQTQIATLLTERLVNEATANLRPVYPADAYYLRQAVVSWLVGRFIEVNTRALVMSSLAANYGDEMVGRVLRALRPDSSVFVLAEVVGKPLDQLGLDWRDVLTWRLVTEDELITRRDEANFWALYDTQDEIARNAAYQRFINPAQTVKKVVVVAQQATDLNGLPVIQATVQVGEGDAVTTEQALFRLVDGIWKRAN
jgi:hypothetical protein